MTLFSRRRALSRSWLTRGYILSVLASVGLAVGHRRRRALAFGVLHLVNTGATVESVALVTFAGVFLAPVCIATRSLYAAWIAHLAWNWTMAVVFHMSVSGLPLDAPRYRYVDAGPDWATGGDVGTGGRYARRARE